MDTKFHINPGSGTVSRCRAAQKCPFGGASGRENHFDSPREARADFEKLMHSNTLPKVSNTPRKHPDSVTDLSPIEGRELVVKASAEYGRTVRTYLRLLNFGNYEMAKGLCQSLKDKETVELVVSYSRLSALVNDKKLSIEKMKRWKRDATIPIKAESYGRRIAAETLKLAELERSLESTSREIESVKKVYTDRLNEHKVSVKRLQSYQTQVTNGTTTQAPLSKPITQLPSSSKDALEGELKERTLSELEDLNSRDQERFIQAAKNSGNQYHIDSALGYRKHNRKIEQLQSELEKVDAEYARADSGTPVHATLETLSKKSEGLHLTLDHEIRVRNDYARRMELFRAEIKDSLEYNSRLEEEVREIIEYGE